MFPYVRLNRFLSHYDHYVWMPKLGDMSELAGTWDLPYFIVPESPYVDADV